MVSYADPNHQGGFDVNLVLILIVVDDGLVPQNYLMGATYHFVVLILIVVDDGLVHNTLGVSTLLMCLNPYCSGRWSRTILRNI